MLYRPFHRMKWERNLPLNLMTNLLLGSKRSKHVDGEEVRYPKEISLRFAESAIPRQVNEMQTLKIDLRRIR